MWFHITSCSFCLTRTAWRPPVAILQNWIPNPWWCQGKSSKSTLMGAIETRICRPHAETALPQRQIGGALPAFAERSSSMLEPCLTCCLFQIVHGPGISYFNLDVRPQKRSVLLSSLGVSLKSWNNSTAIDPLGQRGFRVRPCLRSYFCPVSGSVNCISFPLISPPFLTNLANWMAN